MSRKWFQTYYEYARYGESPEVYNLWTAISTISSVLRRNVWLDQGRFILYPNQYIILVGPPGKVGKGTALGLGKDLLKNIEGVKFIPDSLSREDLIRRMANAGSKLKGEPATVTILSGELSSLIEPSGLMMVSFLTDIYDGHGKWEYSTKHQGRDPLYKPLLNILGATTPSWIANGFPVEAIGHGFTRRTVFVYADEPDQLFPFPPALDESKRDKLIEGLREIAKLKGEFVITPKGREAYEEIYYEIYKGNPQDHRVEGFHWMKKNHVLKVAMTLSVAEDDSLELTDSHIEKAWKIIKMIATDMSKAFSAVGKYQHASDLERIYGEIVKSGGMSETEIYSRNYASGDIQEIAKIIQMLKAMGRVKSVKHVGKDLMILPMEGADPEA
jgi:hypothetical protein